MNQPQDITQRSSYSAMGEGRYDYDACYAFHQQWGLFGLHCHDFYELYIHYSGAKFYCIDNGVYPIEANQLMVVPPFRMHGLIGDHVPTGYERAFLYITPAMLKVCGAGQMDLERFLRQHVASGQYQFLMTEKEGQKCKALLQDLMATERDTACLARFCNYTKLLQFLRIVCQVLSRSHEAVAPIVVNEAMQEILSYVNEHFTQSIKLESLARQFGVSVSFLSHEFVKYTGRSVYDYVLYRRVLLAKEMINSALPLNEIAYQCGFNDYSSFLRAFRKMAGMSPTAYRKMSQNVPKAP